MGDGSERYILVLNDIYFLFVDEDAIAEFVHYVFKYADNKRGLYHKIMANTLAKISVQYDKEELDVMNSSTQETMCLPRDDTLLLNGAGVLNDIYGQIYDPDGIVFSCIDDTEVEQLLFPDM